MSSYYVPLPAPQVPPGIDFGPINNALEAITRQNNVDRQFGLQEKEAARSDKRLAMDTETHHKQMSAADLEYEANLGKAFGGWAQDVLNDPDPTSRASRAKALFGSHPQFAKSLPNYGIDPNDADSALKFVVSQARGYRDPQDVAIKNAQIGEATASAAKSRAEVEAIRRNAALVNTLLPEFTGNGGGTGAAVPDGPTTSYYPPGNAFAAGPPSNAFAPVGASAAPQPGNALMSGPVNRALPPMAPPQNALARPPVSPQVSATPPPQVPRQNIAPAAQPSTALPNRGDPTSFTGDSASGLTTPTRISADTKRAMVYDLALNGGKGMSTIINNDPGSKYATAYATKTAEDNAGLNLRQKMTAPLLAQVQHMRKIATEAGADVLTKATGPNYSEGQEDSWLPGFLRPDTSGQTYQNVRAIAQHFNPFSDHKSYDDAAKLNLQMQHIKKMLGASVKALPGTKGGGASTDQDQALVLDAVGEALHAQDPQTFFKVLHDAENGLRARSGMPPLPVPESYLPDEWRPAYAGNKTFEVNAIKDSGSPAQASALEGARDAIAKGANPGAVKQRLLQNGIDPGAL